MKKTKKITAVIIAAVIIVSFAFNSVSAVSSVGDSYSKYKNYYSVGSAGEMFPEGYFNTLSPEMDELIELYMEYSLYELTRDEIILTMLKNFLIEYDAVPYMGDSLLRAFDDFGGYYSNTSVESLFSRSSYSGYGIIIIGEEIIDAKFYQPVIQHVIRNSPAESAGLKVGDKFIEIDGINIEGLGMEALSNFLSATSGRTKFTMRRDGEDFEIEMTKAAVKYESVSYRIIDESKKLALLTISDFLDDLIPLELSAILGVLDEEGYTNLIIDLRNNSGGDLEILYTILDYFIAEENVKLGTLEFSKGGTEEVFSTKYGFSFDNICILTNRYTISAAEAFSISLSELTNSLIIGEKTYGKGIGQTYFELTNGDIVGITSLELISPKGTKYHGKGVEPNILANMRYVRAETNVEDEKFEQLNFVNCVNIKKDADNKVVLGLNQRLAKIGYLQPDDVTSKCTQKTITAVEIFQDYYGLAKGIDKIDYLFLEYLNYLVTYSSTLAVDGDAQLECAVKLMLEGEQAAKDFAKGIASIDDEEEED